jgi:hypothetical protein
METIDYIDWDEGREIAASVDRCENCGRGGERLTRVPEFDYMGCDDCMEEALAVIERKQAEAAVTSAAADFLRAFPTGRPRFRGTFGSHFVTSRRSF